MCAECNLHLSVQTAACACERCAMPLASSPRSAEIPCGTMGYRARRLALPPSMVVTPSAVGQRDIDSTPDPTTRS